MYEYGLIKSDSQNNKFRRENNDISYEIYGSGIISSYDETINVIDLDESPNSQKTVAK